MARPLDIVRRVRNIRQEQLVDYQPVRRMLRSKRVVYWSDFVNRGRRRMKINSSCPLTKVMFLFATFHKTNHIDWIAIMKWVIKAYVGEYAHHLKEVGLCGRLGRNVISEWMCNSYWNMSLIRHVLTFSISAFHVCLLIKEHLVTSLLLILYHR